MRVAFRLAHGWSQAHVAQLWNGQWPSADGRSGITDKNISCWETWPQSGHEPSLKTLKRLGKLYQCDVGDLIEDGRYSHLDECRQQDSAKQNELALHEPSDLPARGKSPSADSATLSTVRLPDELLPFQRLLQLAHEPTHSCSAT